MSSVFLHWHVSESPLTASPLATPAQHGSLRTQARRLITYLLFDFVQLGPVENTRFLSRPKSLRRLMSTTIAAIYCGEFPIFRS